MSKPKPIPLAVGDRVRERERVADNFVHPTSPNYQLVCNILSQRRYGTVVDVEIKRSSRGSACKYIHVQWDNYKTPSVHASSRIEKVLD